MSSRPDLFAGLTGPQVSALVALGNPLVLGPYAVLFRIGDVASHLYVVEDGTVRLTMPMQVGRREEDVRVDECTAGQALGWSTLVPPHRFTLKATASTPVTLLALPRETLLAHFAAHPETGYEVMRNLTAVLGHRMQVCQAMWVREMQHVVDLAHA